MESGRNGGAGAPSYLAIRSRGSQLSLQNSLWTQHGVEGEFSPTQLYLSPYRLAHLQGTSGLYRARALMQFRAQCLLQSSGPHLPPRR